MSVVQFPESRDASADLQIWNNVAFDNGENYEDLNPNKQSWGSLKSIFDNPKASFDSVSGKENQGLLVENQISCVSTTPFKPVNRDEGMEKSRIKSVLKKGLEENVVSKSKEIRDEKKIDEEIEEIESEILILKSRLEALRLEKAEKSIKVVEKRGRVVPAKFMEQKQSVKNGEVKRRGFSLGPAEIVSGGRRGLSMGPAEIFRKSKGKQEIITPVQSRRKSCFWKLEEIDEEKVVAKERRKSSSISPKSRKVAAKTQVRQAVTTIASRKTVKKEDGVINAIQPKKLFKDGEKSVPGGNKKPLKPGRVVASRYNQSTSQASAMRKRSLPEDDNKRNEIKQSLSAGKARPNATGGKNLGNESCSRVKKRWEIPSEIMVHGSLEGEKSPSSIVVVPDLLPRIRTARCVNESPRDSGPAKKVAELIGRKSFFGDDEEVELSLCQELIYEDGEEEEVEES